MAPVPASGNGFSFFTFGAALGALAAHDSDDSSYSAKPLTNHGKIVVGPNFGALIGLVLLLCVVLSIKSRVNEWKRKRKDKAMGQSMEERRVEEARRAANMAGDEW